MRVSYLISQALRAMKGSWRTNLALLLCVASSFLVFGSFLLITQNLKTVEQKLKGEVQIEVYLDQDITPLQLHLLLQSMRRFPEVERVKYRSQREALVQLGNYLSKELLDELETNPLPASFLLGLREGFKGFEEVAGVASRLKSRDGVEDVEFGGGWLQNLDRASFILLTVDVLFGIFIAVVVIMMVSGFMRMVVLMRAESMQIMSLMGASTKDISLPLIMQGWLLGGGGALLGMLFLGAGYLLFTHQVIAVDFLPFSQILGMIAWGTLLGAGGGLLCIGKQVQNQ